MRINLEDKAINYVAVCKLLDLINITQYESTLSLPLYMISYPFVYKGK